MTTSEFEVKVQVDTPRSFRLVHQLVCLSSIDFENCSLVGFTELSLVPLQDNLNLIYLSAASQVNLETITVNEYETHFTHRSVLSDLPTDKGLRHLSESLYKSACATDPEQNGGQLKIFIPENLKQWVNERKIIKVGIDFWIRKPTAGLHFVVPSGALNTEASADWSAREAANHVFTYRSSVDAGSTRTWLPCIDAPGELCLWKIEITADTAMTAVCSGELMETVYTTDMRRKTYHYQLAVPTSALNIGFAVGPFDICVHPEMSEVTAFSLPKLFPLLKHTTASVDKMLEFFEELLSTRFPYATYKQVFVDQAADEKTDYAGLTIFSMGLLYHRRVLDVVPHSRTLLAHALANQFFGCFICQHNWLDSWVVRALARYITALYVQRTFGNNEYLFLIKRLLTSVCDYESTWGPIFLRALKQETRVRDSLHFDPRSSETCSPNYVDVLSKKGHFVVRMLEKKLGKEALFQVLHRILAVASQASGEKYKPLQWQSLLLSTESFFNTISNVRGWESPDFLEQWVYGGGHAHFQMSYSFNRKRNVIELEIKQEPSTGRGRQKYVGPLTVVVQELDGCFTHNLQIDDIMSRHDLSCHSKGRRQKKKKVPMSTGEETELDLSLMDPDSPILWLRVDPELTLISKVDLRQPDYQWLYQLRYEKDVISQFNSLEVLPRFASPETRFCLSEVLENDQYFYRVRCTAAFTMTEVANKVQNTWTGPPAMLNLFRKMFGSRCCPHIPKPNNFGTIGNNLQMYFIMQRIRLYSFLERVIRIVRREFGTPLDCTTRLMRRWTAGSQRRRTGRPSGRKGGTAGEGGPVRNRKRGPSGKEGPRKGGPIGKDGPQKEDQSEKKDHRIPPFLQAADHDCKGTTNYDQLHRWSCDNLSEFWHTVWEFCDLRASVNCPGPVLESKPIDQLPRWFSGSRLNYAENLLSKGKDEDPAIYFGEDFEIPRDMQKLSFGQLKEKVQQYRAALKAVGVQKGDVVAGLMPNSIECLVAMLGAVSLGAVFSSTSPDFGELGVLERFAQVKPKVLFCVDGVRYNGKFYSEMHKLCRIVNGLSTLETVVLVPFVELDRSKIYISSIPLATFESEFLGKGKLSGGSFPPLEFEQVPFDHPLFILFTSGTTGVPKCMVHSAGGTLLKHAEEHFIQECIGPGDVFFYRTMVSWSVWNWSASVLATGAAIVLFDGSPFEPNLSIIFHIVDAVGVTHLGIGAKLYALYEEKGLIPKKSHRLDSIRCFIASGSTLRTSSYDYIEQRIKPNVLIASIMGATDVGGGCFTSVCWLKHAFRGQGQPPCLGMDIEAWNDDGERMIDKRGELVCVKPFPSMPIYFLNDRDGARYRDAYFNKFDGVWAQNDVCLFDSATGGINVLGRSDGTLIPGGVRYGSAEIYNIVECLPEIEDSICVGHRVENIADEQVVLFLKMASGFEYNQELVDKVKNTIKGKMSPLHVPKFILPIADIPYTVSNKKVEVAVRKMLAGDQVKNANSLKNPQALECYRNVMKLAV